MRETIVLAVGMLVLSLVSGMLGLGVAFAAVPFLSLFLSDLVHEAQPLSLLLNGITAAFAPVNLIWVVYLVAVGYLAYRLFRPVKERPEDENFRLALILAAPISIRAGSSASDRASC